MSERDVETVTFTIAADGEEETLTVPRELVRLVGEEDGRLTEAVGDVAMLSLANQIHHLVHHHEGEVDPRVEAVEQSTMELFEERFEVSFGEATGHDH
jgi:hypothetical protein